MFNHKRFGIFASHWRFCGRIDAPSIDGNKEELVPRGLSRPKLRGFKSRQDRHFTGVV